MPPRRRDQNARAPASTPAQKASGADASKGASAPKRPRTTTKATTTATTTANADATATAATTATTATSDAAARGRCEQAAAYAAAAAAAIAEAQARWQACTAEVLQVVLQHRWLAANEARLERKRADDARRASILEPYPQTLPRHDDAGPSASIVAGRMWHGSINYKDPRGLFFALPCPEVAFELLRVAASRACRAWRDAARRASEMAALEAPWDRNLATLGAYAEVGCQLRAVRAKVDAKTLRALAAALAGSRPNTRREGEEEHRSRDPAADLRAVLSQLHVLKLDCDDMSALVRALRGDPTTRRLVHALAPPPPQRRRGGGAPAPALFASLVYLEFSTVQWDAEHGVRFLSKDLSTAPFLFSRRNFPSLKALKACAEWHSCRPLELAHARGRRGAPCDDAYLPPPLTRLEASLTYTGTDIKDDVRYLPEGWPRDEPLFVARASLAALAPTLRSLHVESAPDDWAKEYKELGRRDKAEFFAWKCHPLRLRRTDLAMARLLSSGLQQLTTLQEITLDPCRDFCAPLLVKGADDSLLARHVRRARQRWQQNAEKVLAPLHRLRKLSLDSSLERDWAPVSLPSALSLLTNCTCLEIRCGRLVSVGAGLRKMSSLQRLDVDISRSRDPSPGARVPLPVPRARDLASLTQLQVLRLDYARPHLARVIATGLPCLKGLMLHGRDIYPDEMVRYTARGDASGGGLRPRSAHQLVLRAARFRLRRGVVVYSTPSDGPIYKMGAREMGEMLEEFEGPGAAAGDDADLWSAPRWPLGEESDDTDDGLEGEDGEAHNMRRVDAGGDTDSESDDGIGQFIEL